MPAISATIERLKKSLHENYFDYNYHILYTGWENGVTGQFEHDIGEYYRSSNHPILNKAWDKQVIIGTGIEQNPQVLFKARLLFWEPLPYFFAPLVPRDQLRLEAAQKLVEAFIIWKSLGISKVSNFFSPLRLPHWLVRVED